MERKKEHQQIVYNHVFNVMSACIRNNVDYVVQVIHEKFSVKVCYAKRKQHIFQHQWTAKLLRFLFFLVSVLPQKITFNTVRLVCIQLPVHFLSSWLCNRGIVFDAALMTMEYLMKGSRHEWSVRKKYTKNFFQIRIQANLQQEGCTLTGKFFYGKNCACNHLSKRVK